MLLILPLTLDAKPATVVAIKPPVTVNGIEAFQGSEVEVGEHVVTGPRSFAVIQFEDGARITVRPNSEVVIERYDYLGDNEGAEISLLSGGLRIVTGAMAKTNPESYTVQTPTALMGVRGTEFSVEYIE